MIQPIKATRMTGFKDPPMNLGFLRLRKKHKSLRLNHKCKFCDSVKTDFINPAIYKTGEIIKFKDGTKYKKHSSGAIIRINEV